MNLVVSKRAARRLVEIARYIREHNPAAALIVRTRLQTTFALIASRPYIGLPFEGQVRRFAVPRVPFVILYKVDEEAGQVTILTVRHDAQRDESL